MAEILGQMPARMDDVRSREGKREELRNRRSRSKQWSFRVVPEGFLNPSFRVDMRKTGSAVYIEKQTDSPRLFRNVEV